MELCLDQVCKRFRDKTAVEGVTLKLRPGIWGLLGANGAGKTTLMRMIAGILEPTEGRICYDGVPISILREKYRDIFGYLPQEFGFYPEFTVGDYLEYVAALKGVPPREAGRRIDGLLERLSLSGLRKKRIAKLSGGMKRRVGIAQALLNDPEVLILDEPTSGLDPGERVRFRNLLSEFAQDRIVLISTHIVSDVERISARNAVMKEGRLIAAGATEELVERVRGRVWRGAVPAEAAAQCARKLRIVNMKNEGDRVVVRYLADRPQIEHSVAASPQLEDLYLWLFPQETEVSEECGFSNWN